MKMMAVLPNKLLRLPFPPWQYSFSARQGTVDMLPALPSGAQFSGGGGREGKEGTDSCLALLSVVCSVPQPRGSLSSDHLP